MSESERAEKLREIQLELFQVTREHLLSRRRIKELKRQFILIHGSGQKRCRKCDEVMDVEQFYPDKRYADGYYPHCRECQVKKITRKGDSRAA